MILITGMTIIFLIYIILAKLIDNHFLKRKVDRLESEHEAMFRCLNGEYRFKFDDETQWLRVIHPERDRGQ